LCVYIYMACVVLYLPTSIKACATGSSVGIATGYGLHGPGDRIPVGTRFPHLSRPALGPTQPPVKMGTGSFLGGKERPGRDANPSRPSSAVVKKE